MNTRASEEGMTAIDHPDPELAGHEACHESLETRFPGHFVVFLGAGFERAHSSFHEAAKDAAERYGDAPFSLSHMLGGPRSLGFLTVRTLTRSSQCR